MIDVISKRCVYDGCNTQPSCNYPSEYKGIYCNTHKLENMIDAKNKRCVYDGCNTLPSCNYSTVPSLIVLLTLSFIPV